jgi:hypothetical protein
MMESGKARRAADRKAISLQAQEVGRNAVFESRAQGLTGPLADPAVFRGLLAANRLALLSARGVERFRELGANADRSDGGVSPTPRVEIDAIVRLPSRASVELIPLLAASGFRRDRLAPGIEYRGRDASPAVRDLIAAEGGEVLVLRPLAAVQPAQAPVAASATVAAAPTAPVFVGAPRTIAESDKSPSPDVATIDATPAPDTVRAPVVAARSAPTKSEAKPALAADAPSATGTVPPTPKAIAERPIVALDPVQGSGDSPKSASPSVAARFAPPPFPHPSIAKLLGRTEEEFCAATMAPFSAEARARVATFDRPYAEKCAQLAGFASLEESLRPAATGSTAKIAVGEPTTGQPQPGPASPGAKAATETPAAPKDTS